jgi:hypothetical protein
VRMPVASAQKGMSAPTGDLVTQGFTTQSTFTLALFCWRGEVLRAAPGRSAGWRGPIGAPGAMEAPSRLLQRLLEVPHLMVYYIN